MHSLSSYQAAWTAALLLLGLGACGAPADAPTAAAPSSPAAQEAEPLPYRNANTSVAFVGDEACFSCHEDLYRSYQTHGMAQSYYPMTAEKAVEAFPSAALYHEPSGFYYRAFSRDGRFYQEEYREDAQGRRTHELVREMQYVVGSGSAARTYLTENNGRLYELPLTWYTQGEKWDFSPGYDVFSFRFDRLIPDRCMACHNSYPETVEFAKGKYAAVPNGIGCERCHGPGALHVEARLTDPEARQEIDYTIVNPAHLSLDRRLDVCQQCHLHAPISLLREGREPFDFRPAQALQDHIALFAPDEPAASAQIDVISHADRMKQSACFIATQAQGRPMDCTTCHDPHAGFRALGAAYFNDTCMECHAVADLQETLPPAVRPQHTAGAPCFSCHMPKVEAEDAPHASFTDHWIRVVEDEAMPGPLAAHAPVQLTPYFARDRAGAEAAVYAGMADAIYGLQEQDTVLMRQGIAALEAALEKVPDHGEGYYQLGFVQAHLGEMEAALPALEAAVRLDAARPERLNALAQAYEATGHDPLRIDRLYRRALSLQPALADVRLNYGRFLETQNRLGEAVAQYQAALAEQPWLAAAHYNLGTLYLRQGEEAAAEAALREAVHLQPDYPEALGNLGLLYASQGKKDAARAAFERAVAADPTHATALGNLGTFYLNEGEEQRAVELLRRAVEQDPRYADGLANLALAYFRLDDMAQARRYAEAAVAVNPSHPLARQILGAL